MLKSDILAHQQISSWFNNFKSHLWLRFSFVFFSSISLTVLLLYLGLSNYFGVRQASELVLAVFSFWGFFYSPILVLLSVDSSSRNS